MEQLSEQDAVNYPAKQAASCSGFGIARMFLDSYRIFDGCTGHEGVIIIGILNELKRDLVDPIKTFTDEVYNDTVVDAKQFYSDQAKNLQQSIKRAEVRAQEKTAAIIREKEEMKKLRKAMAKRALIILAVLAAFSLIVFPLLLNQGM